MVEPMGTRENGIWEPPFPPSHFPLLKRYANHLARVARERQEHGVPTPVQWVAEYFWLDGERIRWGRNFRTGAHYAFLILRTCAVGVAIILAIFMVGAHTIGSWLTFVLGALIISAAVTFAAYVGPIWNLNPLAIPFRDGNLTCSFGPSFWGVVVAGALCMIGSVATSGTVVGWWSSFYGDNYEEIEPHATFPLESEKEKKSFIPKLNLPRFGKKSEEKSSEEFSGAHDIPLKSGGWLSGALKRPQLQKLAKENGIPANGKNIDIIRALESLKVSFIAAEKPLDSGRGASTLPLGDTKSHPLTKTASGVTNAGGKASVGRTPLGILSSNAQQPSPSSIPRLSSFRVASSNQKAPETFSQPTSETTLPPPSQTFFSSPEIDEVDSADEDEDSQSSDGEVEDTMDFGKARKKGLLPLRLTMEMEISPNRKKTSSCGTPRVIPPTEVPPEISAAVHAEFEARVRQQKRSSIPRRSPMKALTKLVRRENPGVVDATTPSGKFMMAHEKQFKKMEGIDRHYLAQRARSASKPPLSVVEPSHLGAPPTVKELAGATSALPCATGQRHATLRKPTIPVARKSVLPPVIKKAGAPVVTKTPVAAVGTSNYSNLKKAVEHVPREHTHNSVQVEEITENKKRKAEEGNGGTSNTVARLTRGSTLVAVRPEGKRTKTEGHSTKSVDSSLIQQQRATLIAPPAKKAIKPRAVQDAHTSPAKTHLAEPARQRKFDINASLKKPLNYVPHKGALPKFGLK
ncbi:hypothetical protein HDU93_006414 [Gonapodya sp. JEL0774]|nr:hypothetical protein HDU93_006414 [Gonapodya sp. JEL0774]